MYLRGGMRRVVVCALPLALVLAGCQTGDFGGKRPIGETAEVDGDVTKAPRSAIEVLVREGRRAIEADDLDHASRVFNAALKLDVTNPDLQFLNGYTYHLIATAGDASKLELAEQGLKLALKFEPGHLAARYQLGLMYMDQRRYELAQGHFAAVALHRPESAQVLYNLAASSYYSRDPQTAEAALNRLVKAAPDFAKKPFVLKAQAVTKAALDDEDAARKFLDAYAVEVGDQDASRTLKDRIRSWSSFYEHDANAILAQYNPYAAPSGNSGNNPYAQDQSNPYQQQGVQSGSSFTGSETGTGQEGFAAAGIADQPPMVVVDVVLIGTQEDIRETRGTNLLNGLQLQFGDPLTGTPGLSFSSNQINDNLNSGLAENTQTITRSINIPAVTYSLNIANSANANNEILAKPSLVAQSGQTSEFFSGTEILAAAVSGGDGDSVSVQKEVGVKLAVTPEALDGDLLRLHVVAERTFLTDPSNSVVFEFRLDTTKTNVNATVTMRYGETLILGGLAERETSRSSDGVPGIMDVPGLNLFFSERSERFFERSILILMTPRRPQYTRQAEDNREQTREKLSDLERDLERLSSRHEDWYTPRPTFSEIFDGLQSREFFEEFRIGDMTILPWRETENQLKEVSAVSDRLLRN